MSLEHSSRPKVSSVRLWTRRINDGAFDVINKIVYPMDAREINRLAEDYGRQTLDSGPRRVLDIGSGTGGLGKAMKDVGLNVNCADVEDHHVYPDIDFFPIKDGKLPFEADTFDASIFRFVLHHTPDPVAALQEAMRVTKGGLLVVYEDVVRNGLFQGLHEYGYRRHLDNFKVTYPESTADKTYSDGDWHDVFDDAGLNVVFQRSVPRIGPPVGHELYVVKEKEAATVLK